MICKLLPSLSKPFCQMFQSFISVGKIPIDWKKAIITPIFKKGLSSDPNNYRPVAVTSVVCKLMERVIVWQMSTYLKDNGLISKQQHGFLKARSTSTNLLEGLNDWTLNFNTKSRTDVAYIDFCRVFDKISHNKLLHKLRSYGIGESLLAFISDFLSGRCQCTRVGSCLSDTVPVISGIIQGSCLGPLLFIIFANDLCDVLSDACIAKIYADDVKLYNVIETADDAAILQHNLDNLPVWAEKWQLEISIHKCFILPIGGTGMEIDDANYKIGDYSLPQVDNIMDLGVTVDKTLKFTVHVNKITVKAHARCSLIHRCFLSRDRDTLLKAYATYVLPLLEYASCVWSPRLLQDIRAVESVQRRFTKRLRGMRNLSYEERLVALHLESLESRRLRADLVMTYKMIFRLVDIDASVFFIRRNNDIIETRGHNFRLQVPNFTSECRRGFFSERVVNAWNALPADIDFSNINRFKSALTVTFLERFCKRNQDF